MKFKNKKILITGAASGIGKSLAEEFANKGSILILSDINAHKLNSFVKELRSNGVDAFGYEVNVSDYKNMIDFSSLVLKEHNFIDVLINNAGITLMDTIESGDIGEFENLMAINFWSVVYGVNVFLPTLIQREEAYIVNISSILGLMSLPGQAAYNSSKAAVKAYTEALKMELADSSINVSSVHPGGIKTDIAINARIGRNISEETKTRLIKQFDKLSYTTSKSASRNIIKGMKRKKRRIVIGIDAKIADILIRIFPGSYEKILGLERQFKKYRERSN
tara:strand:- start:300 stop:1133 length:834 start_codon:yes stop_codon:yes gene_type:complete